MKCLNKKHTFVELDDELLAGLRRCSLFTRQIGSDASRCSATANSEGHLRGVRCIVKFEIVFNVHERLIFVVKMDVLLLLLRLKPILAVERTSDGLRLCFFHGREVASAAAGGITVAAAGGGVGGAGRSLGGVRHQLIN